MEDINLKVACLRKQVDDAWANVQATQPAYTAACNVWLKVKEELKKAEIEADWSRRIAVEATNLDWD